MAETVSMALAPIIGVQHARSDGERDKRAWKPSFRHDANATRLTDRRRNAPLEKKGPQGHEN